MVHWLLRMWWDPVRHALAVIASFPMYVSSSFPLVSFLKKQCIANLEGSKASAINTGVAQVEDGVSPAGRYRCAKCKHDFCADCDLYIHDTLHTCPGCSQ